MSYTVRGFLFYNHSSPVFSADHTPKCQNNKMNDYLGNRSYQFNKFRQFRSETRDCI